MDSESDLMIYKYAAWFFDRHIQVEDPSSRPLPHLDIRYLDWHRIRSPGTHTTIYWDSSDKDTGEIYDH